jgi:HD-GYP domain-containing protein (c-di-GMP phosphodiesterase class II)
LRNVQLSSLQPGAVLGTDLKIPSSHPNVLYKLRLEAGTELTQDQIDRLEKLNITTVPIEDPATDDLDPYIHDPEVEAVQEELQLSFKKLTSELADQDVAPNTLSQLEDAVSEMIDALRESKLMAAYTTLKDHDSYTAQHSLDVAKISLQFALHNESDFKKKLSNESGASRQYIDKNFLKDLGLGTMLHDLGKQDIRSDILNKPTDLSQDEWETMKDHPQQGYEDLKNIAPHFNAPVRVPAHQHHEKFDGTGYPRELEGKQLHLYSRITMCADVYSALSSNRPYRDPLTPSQALGVMDSMQEDGPHFDPDLYEKFLDLVTPYPIGQEVVLSDGRKGVVCDFEDDSPQRPVVRVLSENGERLDSPDEVMIQADSYSPRIVKPDPEHAQLTRA